MLIRTTLKELCDIHYANYANDAKAHSLFNRVGNELNAAAWANVENAPSFGDYCDRIEDLD